MPGEPAIVEAGCVPARAASLLPVYGVGGSAENDEIWLGEGVNQQRAEELADQGRRFRNFLEWEGYSHFEAFRSLKGRSRLTLLAGNGAAAPAGDNGPTALASLNNPTGVAVDSPDQVAWPSAIRATLMVRECACG